MFFIDQSSKGIRVRGIEGRHRSEVDRYVVDNFTDASWRAFDHEWFIPDKHNGRSEIINKMKKLAESTSSNNKHIQCEHEYESVSYLSYTTRKCKKCGHYKYIM
jgi:hypothetical protein